MNKLVSVLAVSALLSISVSVAHANPPMLPFYADVIKMKPEGKLGQVIKQEKIETSVKGAQAWKIAYISSDVGGRTTISTGLVVAPVAAAPKEGRPVLAWAHGTTGTAQNCGPSQVINPAAPLNQYFLVGGNSWTDYGIPNLEEFIKEGYVVVATDYQGLGGGGKHQYAVAGTNGRDLINSARAAISMKDTGASKRTIFYGWSQGGGATIAAASLGNYLSQKGSVADDLQVLGFVAMAPEDAGVMIQNANKDQATADKALNGLIKLFSDNVFNFSHFAMTMWGTQAAYPNLKLTDLFTDQGAKVIDQVLLNKCMHVVADTFNYAYGADFKSLLRDKPINSIAWVKALIDGSVPPVKPVAPVVIYWGTKDTAVPPIMHELYQKQMCAMGANIERIQLPGQQTHFSTPGVSAPMYLQWVKDRVAGKSLGNGCPKS
ncbi:lipase family protein [Polynucleobacter sp. HIN7]|uniref:lipase family protein n=1 Tax=Polynucleobacter sp. HIN7 TaxID=3047866 RepID=UPI0025743302|nr:alpha/beta fold hydrolase [Polynucleobacter sp. HIN7]BEI37390.1 lipase family protein [Polynucleobacter sp. HIN7]